MYLRGESISMLCRLYVDPLTRQATRAVQDARAESQLHASLRLEIRIHVACAYTEG